MKIVREILLGAFLLGLTIMFIVMLKGVFKTGERTSETANKQLKNFNTYLDESDITMYDGKTDIEGSEIISFIKKKLGDFSDTDISSMYVYVKTKKSENTYVNGAYIDNIQDFTDIKFIKPTGLFKGEVIRDRNNVITGIKFTQL